MDPLTIILANVGISAFNTWRNSSKSNELQRKQEEFRRASEDRNRQLMWKLLREGNQIAEEMEAEMHEKRLEDLTRDFDNIITGTAYQATINTWPLSVLPIVMKNQSLGNIIANKNEGIAMHCILTPSNNASFNQKVLPEIDRQLEDFFNLHWSTLSKHPVLYYSHAWKSGVHPTGVEITQLKSCLPNLPTMVVTPYFKPNEAGLVFKLNIWGVGYEIKGDEVMPTDFSYKGDTYSVDCDFVCNEDVKYTTIEEFVPYLQCMIGFVADRYFWEGHGKSPILPSLIKLGVVSTDGRLHLIDNSRDRYDQLLDTSLENTKANPFSQNNLLSLYEGSAELWEESVKKKAIEDVYISYCFSRSNRNFQSMDECVSLKLFSKEDLPFIREFRAIYKNSAHQEELEKIENALNFLDFEYSIMSSTDVNYLSELAKDGNGAAMFRLGEIFEYSIKVERYDAIKSTKYYNDSLNKGFILASLYAVIHDESKDSIRRFTSEELYVLNTLHDLGVITASIFLSQYYYFGPERDNIKVISYLEDAPDTEHPYLYFWSAKVLMDLHGLKEERSIEYNLEKSANYGYIEAQTLLMSWYEKKGNKEKVVKYAEMAAKQGSLKGISKLGCCLLTGFGTYKDKNRGVEMLKFAAQKGDRNALEILNNLW